METNIHAKYYLNDDQLNALLDAGQVKRTNWWLQNKTTQQFINYDKALGIERIKGHKPFDITFPEGTFEPMTELVAGVGDWNTVLGDKHCQQKAYFYIAEDGTAVQCKYNELPSQNGGKLPPMPESEQSETTEPTQQAPTESIPVINEDHKSCDCEFVCISAYVFCEKQNEIYGALDFCSDCQTKDENCLDAQCINCKFAHAIYKKKD